MATLAHAFLFLLSAGIIWFFAGILVGSVDLIAKKFHKTSFTISFFVLGFLTSISEISVAFNSTLDKVPQVSAGNLVGASFVIMLLIVPLLAIANGGVNLKHTLSRKNLLLALAVILMPVLLLLDGGLSVAEGWFLLFMVLVLLYSMKKDRGALAEIKEDLSEEKSSVWEGLKILVGALAIFAAGHLLVEEAVYFANAFSVPKSLIGLILLAIGTNVPELVVAVRSILAKHEDIAFGDYIGSSVVNTPIFGVLAILNGGFAVERSEFIETAVLFFLGLVVFYVFAGTKTQISRKEGAVLALFYALFLGVQIYNFARFAG